MTEPDSDAHLECPDGFITDAEWLSYRLERALERIAQLELSLAAARPESARWFEADRRLRYAREEVEAYEQFLGEIAGLAPPE